MAKREREHIITKNSRKSDGCGQKQHAVCVWDAWRMKTRTRRIQIRESASAVTISSCNAHIRSLSISFGWRSSCGQNRARVMTMVSPICLCLLPPLYFSCIHFFCPVSCFIFLFSFCVCVCCRCHTANWHNSRDHLLLVFVVSPYRCARFARRNRFIVSFFSLLGRECSSTTITNYFWFTKPLDICIVSMISFSSHCCSACFILKSSGPANCAGLYLFACSELVFATIPLSRAAHDFIDIISSFYHHTQHHAIPNTHTHTIW